MKLMQINAVDPPPPAPTMLVACICLNWGCVGILPPTQLTLTLPVAPNAALISSTRSEDQG